MFSICYAQLILIFFNNGRVQVAMLFNYEFMAYLTVYFNIFRWDFDELLN